jgi:uncharacterized DUF497 family protein
MKRILVEHDSVPSQLERQKTFKDSEDAFFEEETGNPKEDVVVQDTFKDGTTLTFVWSRQKSNENIKDTEDNKGGFSFYYARYAYRDPYKMLSAKNATDTNNTSILGRLDTNEEDVILVVQTKKEAENRIRIISATYANNTLELDYYKRFANMVRRDGGVREHFTESIGSSAIKKAIFKRRSILQFKL